MSGPQESRRDLSFVIIPETVVDDGDALRLMVEAHRGLSGIYDRLAEAEAGAVSTVAKLLRADWRRSSEPIIAAAGSLLEKLGSDDPGRLVEPRPSPADAACLAAELSSLALPAFLERLEEIAERCFVCTALVPIGTVSAEVRSLYRSGVEAEDSHLAQIIWFRDLAEEAGVE